MEQVNKIKLFIIECRAKRMSYGEIGELLNISRQRVWQIENPRIRKCKDTTESLKWNKKKRESLGIPTDIGKYHSGLDFIREIVRTRDNHSCQKCLKKWIKGGRKLDVHHLDLKMEGKRDIKYDRENMDKMITLCHYCHLNLHTVREKMRNGRR